jgi:hypothetical protein
MLCQAERRLISPAGPESLVVGVPEQLLIPKSLFKRGYGKPRLSPGQLVLRPDKESPDAGRDFGRGKCIEQSNQSAELV